MRLWLVFVCLALPGCLLGGVDDGQSAWERCTGLGYTASGVLPGAWQLITDNATRGPFEVVPAWSGVPLGPKVEALVGVAGNITSLRWFLDSEGPGPEASPESFPGGFEMPRSRAYLAIRLVGEPGIHDPPFAVLEGNLRSEPEDEATVSIVRQFLDQVSGPHPDHDQLARNFTAYATRPPQVHMVWNDDSGPPPETEPDPGDFRLPKAPMAIASQLALHASTATLVMNQGWGAFEDEPWSWGVSIAYASNRTTGPGTVWGVTVDALDGALVDVRSVHPQNATSLLALVQARLAELGLGGADLSEWEMDLEGHPALVCTPLASKH